jgi:5-methylcytosine-specific restriction protein A
MVAHVLRERNKGLVKEKKKSFTAKYGRLHCECCGLAPADMYGSELDGLIEAHHRTPLSECADDEVRITSLDDLVLLCRNCHGAAHRLDPMPALDALRALLRMRPQALLPPG